jgi:hypothetical protein
VTRDAFQIVGDSLVGRGMSFSVAAFGVSKKDFEGALIDVTNAVYHGGRMSVLPSYDDRFDLHCVVEALRALSVIVGPSATDIIARLLHDQEERCP